LDPEIRTYFQSQLGIGNEHQFVLGRSGKSVVVLSIEGERDTLMIDRLFRSLKDAADRQCSGTLPATVCARFYDLKPVQLRAIGRSDISRSSQPSKLQTGATQFFAHGKRDHVHSIAFLSNLEIGSAVDKDLAEIGVMQEIGSAYVFRNPANAMRDDERLRVFRAP
jgi:hypothetical protein